MNGVWQKRCVCGGLIVGMFVGGMWVEACDRSGVTACPMPRVELNHNHTPDPIGPSPMRQSYVLGTGTGTDVPRAIPPQHIFAAPQSPEFPYAQMFYAAPRMSAALFDVLQKRRYPVVIEGTWHSMFESPDDPAPKLPEQMALGSRTPSAESYGSMQVVGASASSAYVAMTLKDENGVDVTALHRV